MRIENTPIDLFWKASAVGAGLVMGAGGAILVMGLGAASLPSLAFAVIGGLAAVLGAFEPDARPVPGTPTGDDVMAANCIALGEPPDCYKRPPPEPTEDPWKDWSE